jgi:IS1 family transposase
MKINLTALELLLFGLCLGLTVFWLKYGQKIRCWWQELRKQHRGPQQLRLREPGDCPACARGYHRLPHRPRRDVVPWSEVKDPRGAKKQVDTSGYACLHIWCRYFGVTDPAVHALVSDGYRGVDNDILYLRCQCCGKRKTSRAGTPMYRLKTPLHKVAMVLTALSEGVDISAASRIFGHHHSTISSWLERAGQHSARLHERVFFQAVVAGHIQLDELVTKVKSSTQKLWVWTAITAKSKLIVAVHIGDRAIEDACLLFHQLQLALAPGCLPVFASDGLNQYFHGMTAHFGHWEKPPRARKYHWTPDDALQYAQLPKSRHGRKVKFLYSLIRLGTREVIREVLLALELSGLVQTSYVERSNWTLRELIAPLSRRTWSLAYDLYHLWLHIQWGLAYYHFCRAHQSLEVRVRGPSRCRYRTPAMAAGLTHRRWSVAQILLMPVPEEGWLAPFPVA